MISTADFNLNDKQIKNIKNKFGKNNVEKAQRIEKALKSGKSIDFIDKELDEKQSAVLQKILTDKDAANKFLKTEQAQKLLKKILGDK